MLNIIIQYTLNLSGAFTCMYNDFWCEIPAAIRITSHTKIRKVKSVVESAILISLVTRHFNLGVPEVIHLNHSGTSRCTG